jgi:hypothetical protein
MHSLYDSVAGQSVEPLAPVSDYAIAVSAPVILFGLFVGTAALGCPSSEARRFAGKSDNFAPTCPFDFHVYSYNMGAVLR